MELSSSPKQYNMELSSSMKPITRYIQRFISYFDKVISVANVYTLIPMKFAAVDRNNLNSRDEEIAILFPYGLLLF